MSPCPGLAEVPGRMESGSLGSATVPSRGGRPGGQRSLWFHLSFPTQTLRRLQIPRVDTWGISRRMQGPWPIPLPMPPPSWYPCPWPPLAVVASRAICPVPATRHMPQAMQPGITGADVPGAAAAGTISFACHGRLFDGLPQQGQGWLHLSLLL